MAFKMVQGDEDIGIHNSAADLGFFYILPVNWNENVISSLESVCDQDVAAGGKWIVAVHIGRIQMIQRILAAAHIEGIAVCQEGLSAIFFNQVHENSGIVRAKIGQISRLTEMDFNGSVLVAEIDLIQHAGLFYKALQLLEQVFVECGSECGKIDI